MCRCLTLVSLVSLLSLAACDGSQPTEPEPQTPSFDILDAVHGTGNPHFFWLPPVAKNPRYTGTFDPTASPTVEICEWANGCVEPLVARFTMETTGETEAIQMSPEDELFRVNWHAGALELSTDATYRIRVFLGPAEMGSADLDLVANMKEVRKLDTGDFIPLNQDGTLPIKFRIEEGALLEPAETILFNGNILTMDPARSVVEAIAIDGRMIQAVGLDREILRHARESTTLIDLNGQTVMPGIVEPHAHLLLTYHQRGQSLLDAQAEAFRNGITTIGEAGVWPWDLQWYQELGASGDLKLKTSMYLVASDNCGEDFGDWWKAYPPTRNFGEKLRYNGIKIFADGGTCGYEPAVSVPFYDEEPLIYGKLFLARDRIAEWVGEAEASGHQVAVHAIGDAGVREAVEGIQLGLGTIPSSSRHRIEHNVVVPGDLIPRYSAIGIIPIVLHYLPLGWMDTKPGTCEGATRREFYQLWEGNTRAMVDGNPGHPIAFHGDWPYVYLEPFRALFNAVTRIRRTRDGTTCPPQDWQLNTVVTVDEGLPMMTINPAYALFRENEVGSLEAGKLADLIIPSYNPLAGQDDPELLWGMTLWMTMVEGEVVYCAEGKEAYCGMPSQGL